MKFNIDLFARRLREYRSEKSQSDIAQELGINRSTISLLENGKLIPTLDVLQSFCERIGASLDDFFYKDDKNPILLMMGQMEEIDQQRLENVLQRIEIRQKYIAINKRCGY
jgi:transcriptional regulator with XRE-family HTH domain